MKSLAYAILFSAWFLGILFTTTHTTGTLFILSEVFYRFFFSAFWTSFDIFHIIPTMKGICSLSLFPYAKPFTFNNPISPKPKATKTSRTTAKPKMKALPKAKTSTDSTRSKTKAPAHNKKNKQTANTPKAKPRTLNNPIFPKRQFQEPHQRTIPTPKTRTLSNPILQDHNSNNDITIIMLPLLSAAVILKPRRHVFETQTSCFWNRVFWLQYSGLASDLCHSGKWLYGM